MLGAIIGDIAGSKYENNNIKHIDFKLLDKDCHFTDDTVCTLAVAKSLVECNGDYIDLQQKVAQNLKSLCTMYDGVGYGKKFLEWLSLENPEPYESFGNGAAMRVSPVSYVAQNIDQVKALAYKVTSVTHNSKQALKAGECIAVCVFMARKGFSKTEIKKYVQENYYNLDFDIEELRKNYTYDSTCDGSVPQAIFCFLKGKSFEHSIKLAISIGGDSDTIACITGAIAQGYYDVPYLTAMAALKYLPQSLQDIYYNFVETFRRAW